MTPSLDRIAPEHLDRSRPRSPLSGGDPARPSRVSRTRCPGCSSHPVRSRPMQHVPCPPTRSDDRTSASVEAHPRAPSWRAHAMTRLTEPRAPDDARLLRLRRLRPHRDRRIPARTALPARCRVGFAAYFKPGYLEDHWVCEYWHGTTAGGSSTRSSAPHTDSRDPGVIAFSADRTCRATQFVDASAPRGGACGAGEIDPDDDRALPSSDLHRPRGSSPAIVMPDVGGAEPGRRCCRGRSVVGRPRSRTRDRRCRRAISRERFDAVASAARGIAGRRRRAARIYREQPNGLRVTPTVLSFRRAARRPRCWPPLIAARTLGRRLVEPASVLYGRSMRTIVGVTAAAVFAVAQLGATADAAVVTVKPGESIRGGRGRGAVRLDLIMVMPGTYHEPERPTPSPSRATTSSSSHVRKTGQATVILEASGAWTPTRPRS